MPLPADYVAINRYRDKKGNLRRFSVLYRQSWIAPDAADDNGYSLSHAGAGSAGTTAMALGGVLAGVADYARNVVITVTHASSVVAMSGTITGTDIFGNVITEDWSVTATGTSKVFTGNKAFKTVTSITETVAADASANTIIAGTGEKLGLERFAEAPVVVADLEDGAVPTPGVVVARSVAATADARGTYTPDSSPNAALDFDLWYIVEDLYN